MTGLIARKAQQGVQRSLEKFPAVVLLGPRQVGKTALSRSIAAQIGDKECLLLDLETSEGRSVLADPADYLAKRADKLIGEVRT